LLRLQPQYVAAGEKWKVQRSAPGFIADFTAWALTAPCLLA
jgi:hypothetical protein